VAKGREEGIAHAAGKKPSPIVIGEYGVHRLGGVAHLRGKVLCKEKGILPKKKKKNIAGRSAYSHLGTLTF